MEKCTFDAERNNDGGRFMVEGLGFVGFVANVSEDVAPGDSVGATNHPWISDVSERFSNVYTRLDYGACALGGRD